MLSMKSLMKIEINGKDYVFSCDPDSPLLDAVSANEQVNAFLLGRVQQAQKAQCPPDAPIEEQPQSE